MHRWVKLVVEVCSLLCAVGAVAWWVGRWRERGQVRIACAAVLAIVAAGAGVADLHGVGSALNESRKHAVTARAGAAACLGESPSGAPTIPARTRFIEWAKRRLPADGSYALAPYAGPPDPWCVTLVLLPALPAGPGTPAEWTLTLGTVPSSLARQVARRGRSVEVFAPGFVLLRTGTR